MSMLKKLWKDEAGLETIEYAIIASLIVVGLIITLRSIGGKISTIFSNVDTSL